MTAVGGTKLDLDAAGTQVHPPVAWNDTYDAQRALARGDRRRAVGVYFARPGYQRGVAAVAGSHRAVPDIAMSASCTGLVDVYVSAAGTAGWEPMCGTSEATPEFAAIVALADQLAGHRLGELNPALYAMPHTAGDGFVAVTSGNNTVAFVDSGKTTHGHGLAGQGRATTSRPGSARSTRRGSSPRSCTSRSSSAST